MSSRVHRRRARDRPEPADAARPRRRGPAAAGGCGPQPRTRAGRSGSWKRAAPRRRRRSRTARRPPAQALSCPESCRAAAGRQKLVTGDPQRRPVKVDEILDPLRQEDHFSSLIMLASQSLAFCLDHSMARLECSFLPVRKPPRSPYGGPRVVRLSGSPNRPTHSAGNYLDEKVHSAACSMRLPGGNALNTESPGPTE